MIMTAVSKRSCMVGIYTNDEIFTLIHEIFSKNRIAHLRKSTEESDFCRQHKMEVEFEEESVNFPERNFECKLHSYLRA